MAGASVISAIVLYAGIICAVCISAVRIPPMDVDTPSTEKAAVDISSIEEHLLSVQMSAVKSFQSSDGDTFDCIPPSKQLAFHHPSLKDHKLQEAPSTTIPHSWRQADYKLSQVWQQHGRCPNGTIPVRRITARGRRSSSLQKRFGGRFKHEHSVGMIKGGQYYGTRAIFSLWEPYVQPPPQNYEFSLAQLWVLATSPDNDKLNTLEAGWHVFPDLYNGDNSPRLFVYWTSDYYNNTGCYNLYCSGFVQTSSNVLVGGTLSPVSTINGSQFEITLSIVKDPATGHWWLECNGENVGYWPQNLSYLTTNYATTLEWGGEIINTEQNGQHTTTQMGSGNFAGAGYEEAAYVRNLQWVDEQNNFENVSNLQTIVSNGPCYDINVDISAGGDNWGTYFYFGGPGRNPKCP